MRIYASFTKLYYYFISFFKSSFHYVLNVFHKLFPFGYIVVLKAIAVNHNYVNILINASCNFLITYNKKKKTKQKTTVLLSIDFVCLY